MQASSLSDPCDKCRRRYPSRYFRRLGGNSTNQRALTIRCLGCKYPRLRTAYSRKRLLLVLNRIRNNVPLSLIRTQIRFISQRDPNNSFSHLLFDDDIGPVHAYDLISDQILRFPFIEPNDPDFRRYQKFENILGLKVFLKDN